MSWQLNNLPSVGVCPQVGNPQAQGHAIIEVPRRFERNLLIRTSHSSSRYIFEHLNRLEQKDTGLVALCVERKT